MRTKGLSLAEIRGNSLGIAIYKGEHGYTELHRSAVVPWTAIRRLRTRGTQWPTAVPEARPSDPNARRVRSQHEGLAAKVETTP